MEKHIFIDVSILIHKCYHVMDHLETSDGRSSGMEFGVLKSIQKWDQTYDTLTLCFDHYSTASRTDGYKAGRSRKPDEFYERANKLKTALKLKYWWCEQKGVEADTLLHTLAVQPMKKHAKGERAILTNDYDLMQSIQPGVTVIRTNRGKETEWDEEMLWDRFKVRPTYWSLFRTLTGDTSDNLPGCRGIGKIWGAEFCREAVRRSMVRPNMSDLECLCEVIPEANLTERQRKNWDEFLATGQIKINYNLITIKPLKSIVLNHPFPGSIQPYLDALEIGTIDEKETEF